MSTTIIQDLLDELAAAAPPDSSAEPQTKRNSGRTGPTSTAGRCISSQNARTHGACSTTLILPDEREEDWLILLSHWLETYQQTSQDSLLYDFVLKTAQADWFRQRNQNHYDDYLQTCDGLPAYLLTPEQIKMHDLMLRYKNSAERAFQRAYRLLEQHAKAHKPATPAPAEPVPVSDLIVLPNSSRPLSFNHLQPIACISTVSSNITYSAFRAALNVSKQLKTITFLASSCSGIGLPPNFFFIGGRK